MGTRSVAELPVRILTDDELIEEYVRTFEAAGSVPQERSSRARLDDTTIRRNSGAMGELLRRGYRAAVPVWMKPLES